jgi:hypothetical protein
VNPKNVPDPTVFRRKAGIPEHLGSCHTAMVDGYAIEGHVPAREVKRLLTQRPKARGLAVMGMPAGSPGMEQTKYRDAYDVILVLPDGTQKLYARYNRDGTSQSY